VLAHQVGGRPALNEHEGVARRPVPRGTPVRLRLVNANSTPRRFAIAGTPFRVVAIDGTELSRPQPVRDTLLELGGGARYDVAFTMPARPVTVALEGAEARVVLGEGRAPAASEPERVFDPATYGARAPMPFGSASRYDRRFSLTIGRKPGFVDGRPGLHWALNGRLFPDTPVFVVEKGDLVHVTIENDTGSVHPMHLHGHHVLILSRDGVPTRGSPWWVDTLNAEPGERYEVAFRAANTGLWMFHCHNLGHAADGMTMHLAYAGITTPFVVGGTAGNRPE
jgi:FtsP/CotA-like multicopper oxidase with cupredoxin domain